MDGFGEEAIRDHVERICDSDSFRAASKLTRVLRFLVAKTLEGELPVGQRLVAEQALGLAAGGVTSTVAARMQIGRLRKHLADYYAGPGRGEPIRIEVPRRNYRLRFRRVASGARSDRAPERTSLAVVELAGIGLGAGLEWLPRAITRDLIVAFGPFRGLAVVGPVATPAELDPDHAFVLLGDVRADRSSVHVAVRLLEGPERSQVWARAFSVPLAADGSLPAGGLPQIAAVADELADETGVIACRGMRFSAGADPATMTVRDAVLADWRFLMTGAGDDLIGARAATASVAAAVPHSAVAIVHAAMMEFAGYLADPAPESRPPAAALTAMERAASLAPGDPWVQVHRGFARWISRQEVGLEAICGSLAEVPGSGSFRGTVGSLMAVSGIDLPRGERLLVDAIERSPRPLYWFCHHLALCGFRRGDLDAMQTALARIAVRTDPFSLVLRMVLACERGDRETARSLAGTLLAVMPGFDRCGGIMMRRLLHPCHVDAIMRSLAPLGLGWPG